MIASDSLAPKVARFEGCRLKAYRDAVGVWTIGFGNTTIDGRSVCEGDVITQEQAEAMLARSIAYFAARLDAIALKDGIRFSQNQFDALVSFAYNVGVAGCTRSDVWQACKEARFEQAATLLLNHDHAGGKRLKGLTRRRQAESALFATP